MSIPGMPVPARKRNVIAYIDGFNLYFGLKQSGWQRYFWLDLPSLSRSLILKDQILVHTKYFTSRIVAPLSKRRRQSIYLEALEAHSGRDLTMYFGRYQSDARSCNHCGKVEQVPSEKKTDVNIAVEMMTDAFSDSFDTGLIISADSDLVPAILAVSRLFPLKRIVVAFPPKRHSVELDKEAHASFQIGRVKFSRAQMPDVIVKPDGTKLIRPAKWAATQTEFGKALKTALNQD